MPEIEGIQFKLDDIEDLVRTKLDEHIKEHPENIGYHNATTNIDDIEPMLMSVMDKEGLEYKSLLARKSCANDGLSEKEQEKLYIFSINMYYAGSRQIVTLVCPKKDKALIDLQLTGIFTHIHIYRKEMREAKSN